MPKFLIDESLSPRLASVFQKLGYKTNTVRESGLRGLPDETIVRWAKNNKYCIVTNDQDFGTIYYLKERGVISVLLLKSKLQGVPSFRRIIHYLYKSQTLTEEYLSGALIVATEYSIRRHPTLESDESS